MASGYESSSLPTFSLQGGRTPCVTVSRYSRSIGPCVRSCVGMRRETGGKIVSKWSVGGSMCGAIVYGHCCRDVLAPHLVQKLCWQECRVRPAADKDSVSEEAQLQGGERKGQSRIFLKLDQPCKGTFPSLERPDCSGMYERGGESQAGRGQMQSLDSEHCRLSVTPIFHVSRLTHCSRVCGQPESVKISVATEA